MKKSKTIILIILIIIIAVIIGYVIFNINNNNKNENIESNEINEMPNNENTENNQINDNNNLSLQLETNTQKQENKSEVENKMSKLNINVGNKSYTATLYDNETTRALLKEMPLTINMSELNGNEKYYYFNQSFPTNSEKIANIKSGDIMLFGADCLVLFYKDFSTSYSYTKIGHIDNPENLVNVLGSGSVQVTFEEN